MLASRSRLPFGIRDARIQECDALTELCHQSKAHWGYDEGFLARCRDALAITPEMIRTWYVRVAESSEAKRLGVLAVSFENTKLGVESELERLFVDPANLRAGVGEALLNDGRQHALARGAKALWILSDPGAEPFYRRLGAVRVGLRPSDAIPGRMLPWMRLALGG